MRETKLNHDEAERLAIQVKHLQDKVAKLEELVHKLKNKRWVDFMNKEERVLGHGWNDFMA